MFYVKANKAQKIDPVTFSELNFLFGQQFDPSGAIPEYLLHAWIWKNNPRMFSPFNPSIKVK